MRSGTIDRFSNFPVFVLTSRTSPANLTLSSKTKAYVHHDEYYSWLRTWLSDRITSMYSDEIIQTIIVEVSVQIQWRIKVHSCIAYIIIKGPYQSTCFPTDRVECLTDGEMFSIQFDCFEVALTPPRPPVRQSRTLSPSMSRWQFKAKTS
jgi:hypothetical protein